MGTCIILVMRLPLLVSQAAFNAVMNLWNKKPLKMYGGRMSESILAIMCHIIKAEAVIQVGQTNEKSYRLFRTHGCLSVRKSFCSIQFLISRLLIMIIIQNAYVGLYLDNICNIITSQNPSQW